MATLRIICFAALATSLLASSAYAQTAAKPLNLKLPPTTDFPVASPAPASTTPTGTAPAGTAPASANTAPGVYYGDHSGVAGAATMNPNAMAVADSCDDATVNKAQVHGNVTTGVVAGNHVSGSYESTTVNVTKPLGDCEHPSGTTLSISAHVSQGRFSYRGNH